jgi:hypothetical protein
MFKQNLLAALLANTASAGGHVAVSVTHQRCDAKRSDGISYIAASIYSSVLICVIFLCSFMLKFNFIYAM